MRANMDTALIRREWILVLPPGGPLSYDLRWPDGTEIPVIDDPADRQPMLHGAALEILAGINSYILALYFYWH